MQKLYVIVVLIFTGINSFAQDDRSFELWNKNQVEIEPWNKISITVSEKIHYSPKRTTLDLKYGEILVGHQVLNWMEYGIGFRLSYTNLQVGEWLPENRPMLFVNMGKDIGKFEFDFYNRFEYRTYKELNNYFRYRQSLRMKFPAITDWGLQFYVQNESFIKLNGEGIHLARFYAGFTAFEKEHLELKIYYALQKQEVQNHWLTADILGLNLSFDI